MKNDQIAHFCSFPLFWWAMWMNRSFCSNQMSDVSELLMSLTKNERPWAICSGPCEEMSHSEQIAHVAHQKWANELIAHFFWANHSFAHFWTKNERFTLKSNEQIPSPAFYITLSLLPIMIIIPFYITLSYLVLWFSYFS